MVRKYRNLSEEHKKKIGLGNKGKKRSDEARNKISESLKKYWNGIPYENENKESNIIMNEAK
ncbi:NUMOD3 domain-containing DNA-binding protein [Bacteroides uniformis]|uniref:NUMOD3 domain-containing DNA-binding protein n=1 Tax=Bacteroides uniformis TaxID=820 RepID=A0AAW6GKF2_BACUN|nr:NUMOD3 domain-containing DNA-binding protein [Bacteroides uniformis]MDC1878557.1 NUMOD3 domain-containing DNA-binding protein [Bacteroides uniformis]MDC1882593.1 NUMOD3 domain-containing DNA-binding protein [Bacteroides uniformis]